jgi:hypothetical protein
MNNQNSFEKFNEISAEIANEHRRLKDTLAKRSLFPQVGDIVILAHSKTLSFQWVVIKKNSNKLLMLPADNNPLAGSNDINSDLLTLRCGNKFWIHKNILKNCERIGILDNWNLQYALELVEDIDKGKVRSSALQQETDYDPEYQEWMEQVQDVVKLIPPPTNFWEWIKQQIIRVWNVVIDLIYPSPLKLAIPPTAFALVLAVWLPNSFDMVEKSIDARNNQTQLKVAQLKFRWEMPAENMFGFAPIPLDSKDNKAFGEGLLFSRKSLINQTSIFSWLTRKWKGDLFNLGRWTVLLWTASQQDMPDEFWKQQQDILSQFKAKFQAKPEILSQLEKNIEPYLSTAPINKKDLRLNVQNMMYFLAPYE